MVPYDFKGVSKNSGTTKLLILRGFSLTNHAFWGTFPETNSSPLKMDGWNTTFLLGFGSFSGANLLLVSGRVALFLETPFSFRSTPHPVTVTTRIITFLGSGIPT